MADNDRPTRVARFALAVTIASAAALVPAGVAVAKPTFTPEAKAAAIVRPAVVYLEVRWQGWVRNRNTGQLIDPESVSVVERCTGFAVSNDGFIVTAGHCVDPGVEGVAPELFAAIADRQGKAGAITEAQKPAVVANMIINGELGGQNAGEPAVREVFAQRGAAKSGLTSGEAIPARVVSFQPVSAGDVALVKVEKSNQPMVTLADSSDIPVGTDVLAIGYPSMTDDASDATLEPSINDGKISKEGTEDGGALFEITTGSGPGMIGGPVADLNGDVVGLISHGPTTQKPAGNLLAAASVISKELAKAGVANQLGKIDRDFRAGLDNYYDGSYTAAIEKFDQVLAVVPSHAQAQEYRQQAVSRRSTEGDPAGTDLSLLATLGLAAVLVLAVVGATIALMVRNRRRVAPALADAAPTAPPPPPPQARVYCANCGHAVTPGTASCATCGKQFS